MGYGRENEDVTGEVARPQEPRLMDEVRRRIRLKHYSLRTEQAYTGWIRRFIFANGKRHPRKGTLTPFFYAQVRQGRAQRARRAWP
jgi:hypothetical protein